MDKSESNSTLNMVVTACFRLVIVASIIYFVYTSLKGKPSGIVFFIGLVFAYLFYYFQSRMYLEENFQSAKIDVKPLEQIIDSDCSLLESENPPYSTEPINSLDDYEYNSVFDNENDREITKELRSKLMSQYPMDWSTQPASSSYFTKGQKEAVENTMSIDLSQNEIVYRNVDGGNLQPPDTDKLEMEERKVLQTYVPKNTNDLKTYDIEDAKTLIKKIYDVKGLIPEVEHKKDTNVYTIVGTRKKGEKIQYEDELEDATAEESRTNMENITVVPEAARDVMRDSDPFYNSRQSSRMGKHDYTKYTPELERMFAPSTERSHWY